MHYRWKPQSVTESCLCVFELTIADKILLLHIWDIEAPHVGGGHALGEGSQAPPCSEPIREPGQVTVTVEIVGVQTSETDGDKDKRFFLENCVHTWV